MTPQDLDMEDGDSIGARLFSFNLGRGGRFVACLPHQRLVAAKRRRGLSVGESSKSPLSMQQNKTDAVIEQVGGAAAS